MNLREAHVEAETLLENLIKNQPNLLVSEHGHSRTNGVIIANFCKDFIETYSAYLLKRQSAD